ncbi:hypothetical protein [uncultured Chitinophaga sp.]|uniref:hypothetical protein n=1 Tax=uncultured Chitinophaga sp. TaxID=339340 RepID=UPI0025D35E32|nr:hypothetical protein [uncultured Chitinophaga sp.]
MRMSKMFPAIAGLAFFFIACGDSDDVKAPASFTFVNVMATARPSIATFTPGPVNYGGVKTVAYSASFQYTVNPGLSPLYVVQNSDTTRPLFSGSVNLLPGSINTFYLIGDTTRPDTLFTRETVPLYTDSSAGLRIVHVSPASQTVTVNVKGATDKEFADVSYKQTSIFKTYPVRATGNSRILELRNKANDSLLVTFTWNYTIGRNYTLVFTGDVINKQPAALKAFAVNNF